jgi:hypothetical protein
MFKTGISREEIKLVLDRREVIGSHSEMMCDLSRINYLNLRKVLMK